MEKYEKKNAKNFGWELKNNNPKKKKRECNESSSGAPTTCMLNKFLRLKSS